MRAARSRPDAGQPGREGAKVLGAPRLPQAVSAHKIPAKYTSVFPFFLAPLFLPLFLPDIILFVHTRDTHARVAFHPATGLVATALRARSPEVLSPHIRHSVSAGHRIEYRREIRGTPRTRTVQTSTYAVARLVWRVHRTTPYLP